jgi:hypothetical protein
MVNDIGLDFIGSMLMLALRGVRRPYLDRETQIRDLVRITILNSLPGEVIDVEAHVVLLGEENADVQARVRVAPASRPTADLAQRIALELIEQVGTRSKVTLEWIPSLHGTTLEQEYTT